MHHALHGVACHVGGGQGQETWKENLFDVVKQLNNSYIDRICCFNQVHILSIQKLEQSRCPRNVSTNSSFNPDSNRASSSRLYQMGVGIFLYCEIFPPSWPWELSISGDCRLKGLQIFTGNSEHTVVFKI